MPRRGSKIRPRHSSSDTDCSEANPRKKLNLDKMEDKESLMTVVDDEGPTLKDVMTILFELKASQTSLRSSVEQKLDNLDKKITAKMTK